MKVNLFPLFGFIIIFSTLVQAQLTENVGLMEMPNDEDPIFFGQNNGSGGSSLGSFVSDFKLYDVNGDSIILSDVLNTGKNVLMVSGSYTCPIFRNHMSELNSVYNLYGDQIECFVVYTKEAHPIGSNQPTNPQY